MAVLDSHRVIFGSMHRLWVCEPESDGVWAYDLKSDEDLESDENREAVKRYSRPIVCTRDNDQAVSGFIEGRLRVWEIGSDRLLPDFEDRSDPEINFLAVLDSRRVVASLEERGLWVWDAENGQPLCALGDDFDEEEVSVVAVFDGHRVVVGFENGMLLIWDVESGRVLQALEGHSDEIRAVAVLDDCRVVSASDDGTLRVWDVEGGQVLQVLDSQPYRVLSVEMLDSHRVISSSSDGTLRVWDVESGQVECLFTLDAPAMTIAVVPGSRTIVVGDGWGSIHFFELMEPGQAAATSD